MHNLKRRFITTGFASYHDLHVGEYAAVTKNSKRHVRQTHRLRGAEATLASQGTYKHTDRACKESSSYARLPCPTKISGWGKHHPPTDQSNKIVVSFALPTDKEGSGHAEKDVVLLGLCPNHMANTALSAQLTVVLSQTEPNQEPVCCVTHPALPIRLSKQT